MNNQPRSPATSPFVALLMAAALSPFLSACSADDSAEPAAFIPSTQVAAVDTPMPHYPAELGCAGIGGMVVLNLTIGIDGKPANVKLLGSSGQAALDKSALEGVKSWKFEPATRGGKPVLQGIQVPVNFKPPQIRPDDCFRLDEQR